jgi:[acyl-carrier-protein] S-malonyltransferase
MFKKAAFLFPGQGAQYPGMGKDFLKYNIARETFEEADDLLGRKLSKLVFEGPEQSLTETRNSQLAIFVCSLAILRVLQQLFPQALPSYAAGLSLGEYSALCASQRLPFAEGIRLVDQRARCMNDACEVVKGSMAVVLGLEAEQVEELVKQVNLPQDLWVANYNCPGQVVISGTLRGIESGTQKAKEHGAKRVLPLQVHGAFHSGLMQSAGEKLAPFIEKTSLQDSPTVFVMNVSGAPVANPQDIKANLIKQVTYPVRWEQGIRHMIREGVDFFLECGPGKTLAGFNKRIGGSAPFISIEKVEDLSLFEQEISK